MKKDVSLLLEIIEKHLLKNNVHVELVEKMLKKLSKDLSKDNDLTFDKITQNISYQIQSIISKCVATFDIDKKYKPYVMLVCGINGSGKTTMIGKMAVLLKEYGWNIIIAECDTYHKNSKQILRDIVGIKNEDFVVERKISKDTPVKIAISAYKKALKENKDILIVDTSGRSQNNKILMSELLKIKQKLHKFSKEMPHDVVLVVDSCHGYSALDQIITYNKTIGITGIVLTKLDINKNPGIIVSICGILKNIKIFGICYGEESDKIDDIDPKKIADSVLSGLEEI
jgi:fused signal recognition particle receptor